MSTGFIEKVKAFYDRFEKDDIFKTAKRGAEQLKQPDAELQECFDKYGIYPIESVKQALSVSGTEYLKTGWCFAYAPGMSAAGPEYICRSNWKTQTAGSRNVVCVRRSVHCCRGIGNRWRKGQLRLSRTW